MIDRTFIEAKENWQATFRRTRPNVREEFDCLMRTITGGYYWYTPDYKGAFAWGATRNFTPSITANFLTNGILEFVAGEMPDCLNFVERHDHEYRLGRL